MVKTAVQLVVWRCDVREVRVQREVSEMVEFHVSLLRMVARLTQCERQRPALSWCWYNLLSLPAVMAPSYPS